MKREVKQQLLDEHLASLSKKDKQEFIQLWRQMDDSKKEVVLSELLKMNHAIRNQNIEPEPDMYEMSATPEFADGGEFDPTTMFIPTVDGKPVEYDGYQPIGQKVVLVKTEDQGVPREQPRRQRQTSDNRQQVNSSDSDADPYIGSGSERTPRPGGPDYQWTIPEDQIPTGPPQRREDFAYRPGTFNNFNLQSRLGNLPTPERQQRELPPPGPGTVADYTSRSRFINEPVSPRQTPAEQIGATDPEAAVVEAQQRGSLFSPRGPQMTGIPPMFTSGREVTPSYPQYPRPDNISSDPNIRAGIRQGLQDRLRPPAPPGGDVPVDRADNTRVSTNQAYQGTNPTSPGTYEDYRTQSMNYPGPDMPRPSYFPRVDIDQVKADLSAIDAENATYMSNLTGTVEFLTRDRQFVKDGTGQVFKFNGRRYEPTTERPRDTVERYIPLTGTMAVDERDAVEQWLKVRDTSYLDQLDSLQNQRTGTFNNFREGNYGPMNNPPAPREQVRIEQMGIGRPSSPFQGTIPSRPESISMRLPDSLFNQQRLRENLILEQPVISLSQVPSDILNRLQERGTWRGGKEYYDPATGKVLAFDAQEEKFYIR